MQSTIFDTPSIKIESLKTKFDSIFISNSFITLIGDYIEALFLHQLHYWSYSEYGVVINDVRWIYKPYREWLSEVFTFLTEWKLRCAIASLLEKGLIRREKLFAKHHELKHDNPYWHPKNQTYYYSVNYDKLQTLIEEVENTQKAETIENIRLEDSTGLSVEDFSDTKCCELSQNNTKNTSIKNSSKDQSHPTLPSVCDRSGASNQDKRTISKPELTEVLDFAAKKKVDSVKSPIIEKDKSFGQVEQNLNQNIDTNQESVQESVQVEADGRGLGGFPHERPVQEAGKPKLKKTPKGTKPKRKDKAPWKDEGQFKRFYRVLVQALPIVANSHSPAGLAQTIIRQLRSGIPHSYWDDFVAGLPIGSSTKPEWEIEPGVPYPMFIEYLTEKLKAGNNTKSDEQTRNEVFSILEKPRQATAFWGQFKRSVVNVSEQVDRDRALGVSNPHTPVWTRERIEPSIEEAAEAGQKITAVNDATQAVLESAQAPQLESIDSPSVTQSPSHPVPPSPEDPWTEDEQRTEDEQPSLSMREMLAARGVKGFCKPMPKVSQAEVEGEKRKQIKPKTNIAQMSLAEINEYLTDPILRAQLTPQLFKSDYELITDYLGQIIGVELSEVQKRERRRLERESS